MSWEFWALFLIELVFMAIVGLMYTGIVITAIVLWELIERIIRKIRNDRQT